MTNVVSKEDLKDLVLLRTKLKLALPGPPSDLSKEWLCSLGARLTGPHSILHLGYQTPREARYLEKSKMDLNIRVADEALQQGGQYLTLRDKQLGTVQRFTATSVERHLLVQGGPGGGKTVTAMALAIKLSEELVPEAVSVDNEEEDNRVLWEESEDKTPIFFISAHQQKTTDPLLQHLMEMSEELSCTVRVLGWWHLLKELHVEDDSTNLPGVVVSLAQAVGSRYSGRQVILFLDELAGDSAPKTDSLSE